MLDPSDVTAETVAYRTEYGLTGLSFSGISIVSDSASCAAALVGYSKLKHPIDTVAQSNFLSWVSSIFFVKLSPNRYVLNANFHDERILVEHLLVDSNFALISRRF